jgi:hypothetical protein
VLLSKEKSSKKHIQDEFQKLKSKDYMDAFINPPDYLNSKKKIR